MQVNWKSIDSAPQDRQIWVADTLGNMALVKYVNLWWELVYAGKDAKHREIEFSPTHWTDKPLPPMPY